MDRTYSSSLLARRRSRARKRRVIAWGSCALVLLAAVALGASRIGDGRAFGETPGGAAQTVQSPSGGAPTGTPSTLAAPAPMTVIAWNPSHQDDTGGSDWHEFTVCGDIVQRTAPLLPAFDNILCWETGMGLRTGDIAALESEVGRANASAAQIFISIHVNGNNPSGVRAFCYPGDSGSFRYAQTLLKSVAASTGLPYRGVGETAGLYVLDPANNNARIRVLLELGDNVEDRAFLASREGRQRIASALAQAVAAASPGIR